MTSTSRRTFLKASAGMFGAAALYNMVQHSHAVLDGILGEPGIARAQAGAYPANKMSAELPPVSNTIELTTPHLVKEIAPGIPFEVWSFNESGPGPFLHVRQGETVSFTMTNPSPMVHSIDFHAAQIAWDKYYQGVQPGETHSFEFTPKFPGVFMYHCGTPPVLVHIANGMHSAIVVQPRDGWPEPAREYVLVQDEWYLDDGDDEGVRRGNAAKMRAATPDLVVFNGYFNQYRETPLEADPGELIRIHVCNCGPTTWSAFHIIGALFEAAYPDGNPNNRLEGMQTVSVPPGGGYTVELRIPEEGVYPIVTHSFAYTDRGALGLLKVGEPSTDILSGA
jgi:nitrite reductase (NO-forming)